MKAILLCLFTNSYVKCNTAHMQTSPRSNNLFFPQKNPNELSDPKGPDNININLTLVQLNKLRCYTLFKFSANQITWSRLLIWIHIVNGKQCRSRSVGFLDLLVCKGRVYLGSAGQGLTLKAPRKTASENVVCLCRLLNILADFSNLFLHKGKQCGSTLFAKMTFKITSRWQSRRQ